MAAQLPLPFETTPAFGRGDFVVAAGNAEAVAFIDSWPNWSVPAAALYGPSGSGKTHLIHAWAQQSGAAIFDAAQLTLAAVGALGEDRPAAVDNAGAGIADESALFALFQHGRPLLLAGQEPPAVWRATLPDLHSRFAALVALPLWSPDDALLSALARKLFSDRQLQVPEPVIARILRSTERSPAAVRDFVARADAHALALKRPITVQLVGELLDR